MFILVLNKIMGIGGEVISTRAVHVHFQPYTEINGALSESSSFDTLYLRHLAIYILNKYFVKIGVSHSQHIPMPLGEVYKFGSAIGILSEHVYGLEVSSFYNEHLDWQPVESAFAQFGFPKLDHDYYEGFDGPPHNHFNQNHLYPEEKKPSIHDRFATHRWMRIDFEPGSFYFDKKNFIKAMDENQENLQVLLTKDEFYFLLAYKKIVSGEKLEKIKNLQQCIFNIRQASVQEVYERQLDLVRRHAASAQLKINHYDPHYVSSFMAVLNQMPHSLVELRTMVDMHLYKTPHHLEECVNLAMEQLRDRYGKTSSNVMRFFNSSSKTEESEQLSFCFSPIRGKI